MVYGDRYKTGHSWLESYIQALVSRVLSSRVEESPWLGKPRGGGVYLLPNNVWSDGASHNQLAMKVWLSSFSHTNFDGPGMTFQVLRLGDQ